MRGVVRAFGPWWLLGLSAVVAVGCGGGRPRPGGGGGGDGGAEASGPCAEGEPVCVGQEVHRCEGGMPGELVETCEAPDVCVSGLGCRSCTPGIPFCDGNQVRRCNGDGTDSTLEETCPVGQVCRAAACVDACTRAAEERSNVGCEYMVVDLDNEYANFSSGTPPADEQFAVVLANPSDVGVTVQLFQSDGRPGAPAERRVRLYTVPPNDLLRIDLPTRNVDGSSPSDEGPGTHLSNRAYRIVTDYPVVAYQFNPIVQSYSNDASLLVPVPALDTHYRILGWPTANPIEAGFASSPTNGIPDRTYVTIVGVESNTTVRVTVSHKTNPGTIEGGGSIDGYEAGEVIEQVIGPYDVLNIATDGIPGDLTGTVVEASRPVAVFSGAERAIAPAQTEGVSPPPGGVPEDWCCTEHLEEQVFPTTSWGQRFVVTRSPVRSGNPSWKEPDIYRVLADKDGTTVTTNLPGGLATFTLDANEWREFATDRSFVLEASEAVSIEQILVSQGWLDGEEKPGHGGDPSMLLYPPVEQYRKEYIFLAPPTFETNYVVVSAPEGAALELDGVDVLGEFSTVCEREPAGEVNGTAYEAVTCPISGGSHTLRANVPVGLFVYGYHNVGSYSYAGGADLERINTVY